DPTAGEPSTAAPDRLPEAAPQTPTTFGATGRSPEHDGLKRETELVDAARSALARNQPATAIALLDRYRAEFPKGRLVAAAGLVQAESLFASGRAAEAVRVARAHLQINPHGQFADKLAAVIARAEGQSKESPKATSP
ncbi:MAG TPA: hypothetical protein VJT73_03310, partial [Polyangiaceae bacterium]|nr:hypothetical protein [Polyangiaceae bacterium]